MLITDKFIFILNNTCVKRLGKTNTHDAHYNFIRIFFFFYYTVNTQICNNFKKILYFYILFFIFHMGFILSSFAIGVWC